MTLPNTWVTGQTFTAADADNVANAVNAATIAAAAAYTKPGPGIPKTDLAAAVQTSLGLADSSVQPVAFSLGSLGSTYTLTAANAAGVAFGTLTANTAVTLPSPTAGAAFTLVLVQNATGGFTPSFTGATVDYPAGSPNWITTANAVNVLEFRAWDSSAWHVFPATSNTQLQPLNSNLTAIAALTPANDDFIQRKIGAWTNRTPAQLAADLPTGGIWTAPDHGLIAWAYDPGLAASQTVIGSGTVVVIAMKIPRATTITNVLIGLGVVGSGLVSSQCYAGLYQGGALLAATADQSANWASGVGLKTMALTTPQAVSAGIAYVGLLTNGTTNPQFARSSAVANLASVGLSGANSRYATADTARTTLPSTLGTMTAASVSYWAAVS